MFSIRSASVAFYHVINPRCASISVAHVLSLNRNRTALHPIADHPGRHRVVQPEAEERNNLSARTESSRGAA